MFTSNPYATVAGVLSADFMKWYVIVMILAVILGTLWDVIHKGSAKYFFATFKKTQDKGAKPIGGGEMVAMAVQTGLVDVATSAEFCNQKRRLAHLLTMYGFILHMATTAIMAFSYPTAATPTPALVTGLWWIGGLMLCLGGYWFWFFIRVDVSAEGSSPFRLMKADLFVLSLLASTTLGLLWAAAGGGVGVLFGLYLLATAVLFFGVPPRSSRTCSSSPRRPSRSGSRKPTARTRTCLSRPATTPSSRSGTPWSCCRTRPWTWASASSANRPATTKKARSN